MNTLPKQPIARPMIVTRRAVLLLIMLFAFALRLSELSRQNIWWDEARNIEVALRPFLQIASAPELDIQPPFYFWLLHGWGRLATIQLTDDPQRTAFLARFLSVAAGLVATALLHPLGKQLVWPSAGLLAVFVALLSPFWLAESQESRMYTVAFALLTAAAVALLRGVRDWRLETPDWRLRTDNRRLITDYWQRLTGNCSLALVVLSALAVLTHYNALFVLVAWYGWWGGWALFQPDRWRRLRTLVACGVTMTLLLTPMIPIALRQIPTYANPNLTIPSLTDYLNMNWRAYWGGYAFEESHLLGYGTAWLWAVAFLLVAGSILSLVRGHTPASQRLPPLTGEGWGGVVVQHSNITSLSFLLVWVVGSLGLYYMAVLERGTFNVRYSSLITPALYVLLGSALAALGVHRRGLAWIGGTLLAIGMIPGLYADLYEPRFAREDIAGVTQWLRQQAGAEDLILVDQKYPFGFYYQRYTMDPAATPRGAEAAPARYLFVDVNTIDQRLNQWAGNARQIFWVQWFESDTDPRHAVPFLLDKVGQRAGEQSFQGYSIDWWRLTPPNRFELAPQLTPARFAFPPAVETVAVSLPGQPVAPGRGVGVAIRWQRTPGGEVDQPLKARVALYDANDARLAQSDERLLNDRHLAPSQWSAEEQPLNVYWLATPTDLAEGSYAVRLLVYDAETLEPLTLVDVAGAPAGIEATLGTAIIKW
jgi:predicted permease